MSANPPAEARRSVAERNTLRVFAVFKLMKAVLLVLISVGAFRYLHRDLDATARTFLHHIRADPEGKYFHAVIARVASVTPQRLEMLGVATAFYGVLYLIEGVGLWLAKEWAEWVTLISSSLLLPVEVLEVVKHGHWQRVLVLVINLGIVVYLGLALRWKHRKRDRILPA